MKLGFQTTFKTYSERRENTLSIFGRDPHRDWVFIVIIVCLLMCAAAAMGFLTYFKYGSLNVAIDASPEATADELIDADLLSGLAQDLRDKQARMQAPPTVPFVDPSR